MTFPRLSPKDLQRLWDNIVCAEVDHCWRWTGPIYDDQCARFCFNSAIGKKHSTTARSLLFVEEYGPVPLRTRVYNACNSRLCMNPEHFFLAPCGYHKGERMSGAFLSLAKAREMRQKKIENPTLSYERLGAMWQVTGSIAFNICKNRVWKEPKWPYRNSPPTV